MLKQQYCKSGNKPSYIPHNPAKTYSKDWISYGDWLGTGRKALVKTFIPFEEGKAFAIKLKFKTVKEWHLYCKSDKKPSYIPSNPERVYKDKGWICFGDWLGNGKLPRIYIRPTRKQLLDNLITLSQTLGRKPKVRDLSHTSYGSVETRLLSDNPVKAL
jgi:hypothetical protein